MPSMACWKVFPTKAVIRGIENLNALILEKIRRHPSRERTGVNITRHRKHIGKAGWVAKDQGQGSLKAKVPQKLVQNLSRPRCFR